MMSKFFGVIALLVSITATADSRYLDSAYLNTCHGRIELREANGDLSLKFENMNTNRCSTLRIYDSSSGRTIRSYYNVQSNASYTLSRAQAAALSDDCRLGVEVSGFRGKDQLSVVIPWCSIKRPNPWPFPWPRPVPAPTPAPAPSYKSYQLSNKGNCKLMIRGQYSNQNVADAYCAGARGNDIVTYEWSNRHNCKRMINGRYTNQNVSDYMCY